MIFKPFRQQREFLQDKSRIRLAAAGRRAGKSEVGAIESIIHAETQPGWDGSSIDEYIGVIIAPTTDMLRRLSLKKFLAYARPFNPEINKTFNEIRWHNGSLIYGMSADRPQRLEGIKASWIWIDETLQVDEQIFTEAMARVADTRGRIWCTGSLGVQYTNPRQHWVYKHFKQKPLADSACFEWGTIDNPYFPRDEIARLRDTLDPQTFRQMFELSWDTQSSAMVYEQFTDANVIRGYKYDPSRETYFVLDFGFAHEMAGLFIQYDPRTDTVYVFDEIVSSRLTLEQLYDRMMAKPYRITGYFCDIAGTQEREQTGLSNVTWFKNAPRNIHFKYRQSAIQHGVSLVRSYVCNAKSQRRLFIDEVACPKTLDGVRNYSYPVKNGIIVNENPVKKDDDCVDALRYFIVNRLDFTKQTGTFTEMNRWKLGG